MPTDAITDAELADIERRAKWLRADLIPSEPGTGSDIRLLERIAEDIPRLIADLRAARDDRDRLREAAMFTLKTITTFEGDTVFSVMDGMSLCDAIGLLRAALAAAVDGTPKKSQ
jgi:hypothetical protein